MAFLLCDPGWYAQKSDVQNKWDDNTHTTQHTASISESELQAIEKTVNVLPIQHKVLKSASKTFLALGGLHEDKLWDILYKHWPRPIMSKRFKPPYSRSRATSIDSDCGRLPTASVFNYKAANHAPISFGQQAQVSQHVIVQK